MINIIGHSGTSGAIKLSKYAKRVVYSEPAFFGVYDPITKNYQCDRIWPKEKRDSVVEYLLQAEALIEGIVGYPLSPKWISGDMRAQHDGKVMTSYGMLLEPGIMATAILGTNVAADLSANPATVTIDIDPLLVSDLSLVHVFYPGTDEEIEFTKAIIAPSSFGLTPLIITIPWCRMIDFNAYETHPDSIDGTTNTDVQKTVDIKYIYTITSTEATLVFDPSEAGGCILRTHDACEIIIDSDNGAIMVKPATYDVINGWLTFCQTNNMCGCSRRYITGNMLYKDKTKVSMNYKAGLKILPRQLETAVIRLAHSLMPQEPCGCEVLQSLWARDRNIPAVLTGERLECPFGLNDGAWFAWKLANQMIEYRLGVFN